MVRCRVSSVERNQGMKVRFVPMGLILNLCVTLLCTVTAVNSDSPETDAFD